MFTLAKIPVRIYPLFIVVAGLIGWLNTQTLVGTLIWLGIIFISVLVHECGHALTARMFGQRAFIELVAMGGVTQRNGPKLKWWQEFFVIFNGPCAGLLLSAIAYYIVKRLHFPETFLGYALSTTVYVNLFWTAINLLPIQPLDGGHLFAIVLEGIFGFKGLKFSLFISIILAGLLSLLFFAFKAIIAGTLFLMLAFESYRSWKSSLSVREPDRSVAMQALFKKAESELAKGNKHDALSLLGLIRDTAKDGVIYRKSTETMAMILAEQGNTQQAIELLLPIKDKISPEGMHVLHHSAYLLQEWQIVADYADRAYQLFPQAEFAIANAVAFAALNRTRQAIGWLQRAKEDGASHLKRLVERPEFDPIRHDYSFQTWLKKLEG